MDARHVARAHIKPVKLLRAIASLFRHPAKRRETPPAVDPIFAISISAERTAFAARLSVSEVAVRAHTAIAPQIRPR